MNWSVLIELFGMAMLACLALGAVAPVVGVHLYLRRTSLYGLALPQFAAMGVALGYVVLPWWIDHVGLGGMDLATAVEDNHAALNYHLAWATGFTLGGLAVMLAAGRGQGSETARVAGAFAFSSAATVLLGNFSPAGEVFVEDLLRGEILAVGIHEIETLGVALLAALAILLPLGKGILLAGYDPDMARVLGLPTGRLQAALALAVGLVVAAGTLSAGPVVLFGLLVLPPVAARPWARSMTGLFLLASFIGSLSAAAGIAGSFELDLPLGPCVVVAAGVACLPGWLWSLRRGR